MNHQTLITSIMMNKYPFDKGNAEMLPPVRNKRNKARKRAERLMR